MRRLLPLLTMMVALLLCATAGAATLTATPATVISVAANAADGDTVELAAGNYGVRSFTAKRAGWVTITPAPGATVTLYPDVNGGSFYRFTGFAGDSAITNAEVKGTASHIEFTRSRFTSAVKVQTINFPAPESPASNVLFDGNTHLGQAICSGCQTGRISLPNNDPSKTSGVTIRNSVFGDGGTADGILNGSNGTRILDNEFRNLTQCDCTAHTDSIQLYGSMNTVIRGNYVHDSQVAIMAPDGGDHEVIENNVFVGNGSYKPAIQLGSHTGTVFTHNTVKGIDVNLDAKNGQPASTGGVVRDNVLVGSSVDLRRSDGSAACTGCTVDNNLFLTAADASGQRMVIGSPTFRGGPLPTTFDGWALAPDSVGVKAAADGADLGIAVASAPVPSVPPTPPIPPTPPAYDPACKSTCDQQVTDLSAKVTALNADVSAAQSERDAARTERDALSAVLADLKARWQAFLDALR